MGFWQGRRLSIGYALTGIRVLFATQVNARIHGGAALLVIGLGAYLRIGQGEWLALLLAIALVWVAEALNTAIEFCVDLASPAQHPLAAKAKDVAAGAVLLAAAWAVVIGLVVFVPYLR